MATRQIFNASTQQAEDAELTVDNNNEIVATFTDESFLKFPAGLTEDEFNSQIDTVQEANDGQEVITPEMEAAVAEQRAASLELIGDKTNDSEDAAEPTDEG